MRALVGDHTFGDLPPTIIDLEHLRAASRGTRQLTQGEYERREYPRQVRMLRNYHNMRNLRVVVDERPSDDETDSDEYVGTPIQLSDSD